MSNQPVSTAEIIWKALVIDPHFGLSSESDILMNRFRPFVEALPEVLGKELLASSVSVKTLMQAKLLFLTHCLEGDYGGNIAHQLRISVKEGDEIIVSRINDVKSLAENTDATLEDLGLTEDKVLANPKHGIHPEILSEIKNGMTIGELIIHQPAVIVVNPL